MEDRNFREEEAGVFGESGRIQTTLARKRKAAESFLKTAAKKFLKTV